MWLSRFPCPAMPPTRQPNQASSKDQYGFRSIQQCLLQVCSWSDKSSSFFSDLVSLKGDLPPSSPPTPPHRRHAVGFGCPFCGMIRRLTVLLPPCGGETGEETFFLVESSVSTPS